MTKVIYKTTPENKKLYQQSIKPFISIQRQLSHGLPFMPSVNDITNSLTKMRHFTGLLKTDLSNFFESIPRSELILAAEEIAPLLGLTPQYIISTCFKSNGRKLFLPVGYSTSPFFSEWIINKCLINNSSGTIAIKDNRYISETYRYVDDILVIWRSGHLLNPTSEDIKRAIFKPEALKWINFNESKTVILDRQPGSFRFLGANVIFNHENSCPFKIKNTYSRSKMSKYYHLFGTLAKQQALALAMGAASKTDAKINSETEMQRIIGHFNSEFNEWVIFNQSGRNKEDRLNYLSTMAKNNISDFDYCLFTSVISNRSVLYNQMRNYFNYVVAIELNRLSKQYIEMTTGQSVQHLNTLVAYGPRPLFEAYLGSIKKDSEYGYNNFI